MVAGEVAGFGGGSNGGGQRVDVGELGSGLGLGEQRILGFRERVGSGFRFDLSSKQVVVGHISREING